ncbi:uncharacterized protein LOC119881589 [Canis lupus familiaris]|uniref:uncharacterized protein LOC119881589 n=1 Tax=Canis lupus familiaris TaxID=9615 RepID=UPI0018F7DB15|nr:uncharacterized protein LOC119881589 [Canis lupus familiaris]
MTTEYNDCELLINANLRKPPRAGSREQRRTLVLQITAGERLRGRAGGGACGRAGERLRSRAGGGACGRGWRRSLRQGWRAPAQQGWRRSLRQGWRRSLRSRRRALSTCRLLLAAEYLRVPAPRAVFSRTGKAGLPEETLRRERDLHISKVDASGAVLGPEKDASSRKHLLFLKRAIPHLSFTEVLIAAAMSGVVSHLQQIPSEPQDFNPLELFPYG